MHALSQLRASLKAPQVPVLVGGLGGCLDRNDSRFAYAHVVNAGLAKLPAELPASVFVTAHDLAHRGDRLHFDTPSQNELGKRYAQAWLHGESGVASSDVCGEDVGDDAHDAVGDTCAAHAQDAPFAADMLEEGVLD